MTLDQAIVRVKELMLSFGDTEGCKADVELWDQKSRAKKLVGIRVAEIGWTKKLKNGGMAGSVYMAVDMPHGLLACAAAERLIIALIQGWESDEIEDEEWRFLDAIGAHDKAKKP